MSETNELSNDPLANALVEVGVADYPLAEFDAKALRRRLLAHGMKVITKEKFFELMPLGYSDSDREAEWESLS